MTEFRRTMSFGMPDCPSHVQFVAVTEAVRGAIAEAHYSLPQSDTIEVELVVRVGTPDMPVVRRLDEIPRSTASPYAAYPVSDGPHG
jgi:hypothetical protein